MMMKAIRILRRYVLSCFIQLALVGVLSAEDLQKLQTVPRVNLNRYVGTWYEIARLPNWFQDQCVGDVTADYRQLIDGNIEVINRCVDEEGQIDEARGLALIVDPSTNAKLEVSFVSVFGWRLFWGDYWILGLGDDYEYVVVGMPSRKYAWVLARNTELSPKARSHVRQILVSAGYDPEKLVTTRHKVQQPK